MFNNAYWSRYWADPYWPPVGQDLAPGTGGTRASRYRYRARTRCVVRTILWLVMVWGRG